jgi:SAM-dependent methyltransferase
VPDAIFTDPRLAEIYDDLDADRRDLDHYVAMIDEFGATSVLDVGCGTGILACRLAASGLDVIGVDPAAASLTVARHRPGADRVRWLLGDATTLPPMRVDAATMTGNVAQVFVDDESWLATLRGVRATLGDGGHLVFEVRDPAFRGWEEWTEEASRAVTATRRGPVESWVEVTAIEWPLVSFRWTYRFLDDRNTITSTSTLRFRGLDEIRASLRDADLATIDVRDAPDRPGREFVVVAAAAP